MYYNVSDYCGLYTVGNREMEFAVRQLTDRELWSKKKYLGSLFLSFNMNMSLAVGRSKIRIRLFLFFSFFFVTLDGVISYLNESVNYNYFLAFKRHVHHP